MHFSITTLSTVVYPQLPLVEYKPVIVGGNNNKSNSNKEYNFENNNGYFPNIPSYSTPNRSTTQNFQIVGAYFFDTSSKSFKRTKSKSIWENLIQEKLKSTLELY